MQDSTTQSNVLTVDTMSAPTSQGSPAQTGALMAVAGRLKDYSADVFKQRKPWTEVIDKNAFSKPQNLSEATTRLRKNLAYFKVNYLMVVLLTLIITFITNPQSLFIVGLLLTGWVYVFVIRTQPLIVNGRSLSEREKLMAMSGLSVVTIFFLTNVGALLFSAISMSAVVVALHGATRVPDDLFLDEAESKQGLLSIFSAPASGTATV